MTFDEIINGHLWAVRYEGEQDNVLYNLFDHWNDVVWLRSFFKENKKDLVSYFKIEDINQAIKDTIDDSEHLERLMMDVSLMRNFDTLFRPLDNSRMSESVLSKEKARPHYILRHVSWLRIYAIKLASDVYIITGGAIKLTATMQEREHTRRELVNMEKVRSFLLNERIIDEDGFLDYMNEIR